MLVLLGVVEGEGTIERYYTWFQIGTVDVGFTLRAEHVGGVRQARQIELLQDHFAPTGSGCSCCRLTSRM